MTEAAERLRELEARAAEADAAAEEEAGRLGRRSACGGRGGASRRQRKGGGGGASRGERRDRREGHGVVVGGKRRMDRRMDRASRAARRRRRCPRGSFNNTGGDADGIVPPRPPVPTPSAHRVGASRRRGARRLLRPAKGSRYNRYSQGRRVTGSEAQGSRRRGHRRRRLGTRDVDRTVAAAAHPGGGSRAEGEAGEGRQGEGGAARPSGAQGRRRVRCGGRARGNRLNLRRRWETPTTKHTTNFATRAPNPSSPCDRPPRT